MPSMMPAGPTAALSEFVTFGFVANTKSAGFVGDYLIACYWHH